MDRDPRIDQAIKVFGYEFLHIISLVSIPGFYANVPMLATDQPGLSQLAFDAYFIKNVRFIGHVIQPVLN
jgi:hypothetical protein